MKQTITAAELFVIAEVLNKSLCVLNYQGFTQETRERVRDKVFRIMENMSVGLKVEDPQCNETETEDS